MGKKTWAYTNLSTFKAVRLNIKGVDYEVSQYTASFAVNEIPQCQCLVAVGRDAGATKLGSQATIHQHANDLLQMVPATVYFRPKGDYRAADGSKWPEEEQIIFLGRVAGMSYRKVNGKIMAVVNLIHWLADLAFSSATTKNGHPGNPTDMNVAAVLHNGDLTQKQPGNYVSYLTGASMLGTDIHKDVWGAMKNLFCKLAQIPTMVVVPPGQCGGGGKAAKNDMALAALGRIEGVTSDDPAAKKAKVDDLKRQLNNAVRQLAKQNQQQVALEQQINQLEQALAQANAAGDKANADAIKAQLNKAVNQLAQLPNNAGAKANIEALEKALAQAEEAAAQPGVGCSKPYNHAVPLKLDLLDLSIIEDALATSIGNEAIESYAGTTFWAKLIGQFCPMFGMAVVPLVESALVVADVPSFRTAWKEIGPEEYDTHDFTSINERPLRGVGVLDRTASQTMVGNNEPGNGVAFIGGCYIEDSVEAGDGLLHYVAPPPWLSAVPTSAVYSQDTTGLGKGGPSPSATNPGNKTKPGKETAGTIGTNINQLYNRYAQTVYVFESLRGRGGAFGGHLRFDIAPGSIVHLKQSTEQFIGEEDSLATGLYGCVTRVTIGINAEAALAGTSFQLTHLRTEKENELNRSSVDRHPLFTPDSIWGDGTHGAPLVDAYDIE